MAVASNCKQLTTLDRMYCCNITDAAVVAVASGCPPLLTTLKLFLCSKITDEAVVTIAKPFKGALPEACHGATKATAAKFCLYFLYPQRKRPVGKRLALGAPCRHGAVLAHL